MRIRVLFILPFLSWLVLTSPSKTTPGPTPGRILPPACEVSPWVQPVEGCPSELNITQCGRIVAGKTYNGKGNDLPELSCNGSSLLWYKDTQFLRNNGLMIYFGSVIVNPGCTLIIVSPYGSQRFSGPTTIPNPKPNYKFQMMGVDTGTIFDCGIPCVHGVIWTCKQAYPSCTPGDKWQIVTKLDNAAQNISAQFTYEKTVGTEWSQSMAQSQSVSTTVSAEISLAFWGVTAKLATSTTTGYDWTSTDSTTKSESKSYKVSVTVPPQTKVTIEEVVGFCGGSKIHTQMFRVLDTNKGTTKTYHGAMTSHDA